MPSVAYAGKKFGGFKVMTGLVGGPGAELPGRWRIFENVQKNFLRKLQKVHYFSIFFKKNLTNHALIFRAFGRKTQIVGKF